MSHNLIKLPHKLDEKTAVCRAVVETPKGRRGKYDYDPKTRASAAQHVKKTAAAAAKA